MPCKDHAARAFYAGLIVLVSRRHNWARILLLVLALIGPMVLLYPWPEIDNSYWTVSTSVSHIGFLILDGIALYLLFTGEGAAWFARRPKEAP